MQQASNIISLAESDEEDYVSFDEEELNTGIADLYDEDSASDYNEDSEEADMDHFMSIEAEALEHSKAVQMDNAPVPLAAPIPAAAPVPSGDLLSFAAPVPNAAPAPSGAPIHHFPTPQQVNPFGQGVPAPAPEPPSQSASGGLFSSLFRSMASESAEAESNGSYRSGGRRKGAAPAPVSERGAKMKRKKSKHSQLNKRLERLSAKPQRAARRKEKKVIHRQKVNTNIIQIDLGTLKEAADNIATGDAFCCTNCGSVLSVHDELVKQLDDIKLDDEDDSIWKCTFCNHVNIIQIDDEERPTSETVDYILAPPPTLDEEAKSASAEEPESQILFCIDISGSMCVSQQIDGKHSHFKLKGNHLNQDHDDLSQFIDGNANHLNRATDIQYVSRLQCVQTAVDEQVEAISKSHPHYKLGLVTFNNEVTVIGDGVSAQVTVAGDKLNDLDKLKEIGTQCKVEKTIGECREKLSKALWSLKETGQTALGPALAVSVAMASSKPGSQVILCTDGLANVGVGSLEVDENQQNANNGNNDDDEEDDPVLKWYEALGDYAVANGVIVNIISITDDGCRLENLGKIVEITNGNLKRINPLNLAEKFSGIIENESIATNCQAKMIMHSGLKFHDSVEAAQMDLDEIERRKQEAQKVESVKSSQSAMGSIPQTDPKSKPNDIDTTADTNSDATATTESEQKDEAKTDENNTSTEDADKSTVDKLNEGRTIYTVSQSVKDCGNVFEGSRIFFEYVIDKEKRKQFQKLKALPFQVQIEYQKKDGSKMLRVISQMKEVTMDKKAVRKNLDFDLMGRYGTHVTTELCAKGDYESSRMWTASNVNYMQRNCMHRGQALAMANFAQENVALDHQMQRRIMTESIQDDGWCDFEPEPVRGAAISGLTLSAARGGARGAVKKESKSRKKESHKSKKKKRKTARDDAFSSHMYSMKGKKGKK